MPKNIIDVFIVSSDADTGLIDEQAVMKLSKNLFGGRSDSGRTEANINYLSFQPNPNYDSDYCYCMDAFAHSNPDRYVVICKDTTISNSSTNEMFNVLEKVIDDNNTDTNLSFDIFYMAHWASSCHLYHNFRETNSGIKIVDTPSSNGFQCLLFSPKGKQKFVNKFNFDTNPIKKSSPTQTQTAGSHINASIGQNRNDPNNFYAVCTTPPLMNFDITRRTNDLQLIKANECRSKEHAKSINQQASSPTTSENIPSNTVIPPKLQQNVSNSSSDLGVFWFIIILIVVIILIVTFVYWDNYTTPERLVFIENNNPPASVARSQIIV